MAQIVPDHTLPVNSVVTPQGNTKVIDVDGVTRAGSNLFHSFQEFSVRMGETASFNNPLNIQNIFTRVTGKSVSNIDGWLKANGNANVFLLNPNGIIFGQGAKLEIGGSFVGSTAGSIKFTDGSEFSAINPQSTSLLSITVPLGLQFPPQAANIINRSANLQGTPGKTIALVGGDITFLEGAQLMAPQGRIELGSVGGNSLVSLNSTANGWTLGYGGVNNFGNIQLLSQSTVSASGDGGEIFVRAKDLTVTNGSKISVDAGKINLQANAVEVSGASANGQNFSTIAATSRGTGDSGNIDITTNRLIAKDGGDVSVTTFSSGKGGNLTVNASESIQLSGAYVSLDGTNFSRSGLFAATEGTGNAGILTINTPLLQVKDGARVSVSTRGRGQDDKSGGDGGNLVVNAGTIELSGVGKVLLMRDGNVVTDAFVSGLFALSGEERPKIRETEATGQGGNIEIKTGSLSIRDGAQVSTATYGRGKGGNITVHADAIEVTGISILRDSGNFFIKESTLAAPSYGTGDSGDIAIYTRQLKVSDGADVSVTAFKPAALNPKDTSDLTGNSGNLTVNATELIELSGAVILDVNHYSRSGLFAATEGTGNAQNLTINTPLLQVKDRARVSVSTRGRGQDDKSGGDGGNLVVNAGTIELSGISPDGRFPSGLFALSGEDRPSYISEKDATGPSGNLTINTTGLLSIRDGARVSVSANGSRGSAGTLEVKARTIQLRGNAQISTNAGSSNGGNITIDANTLAVLNNSSIRADGRLGGKVSINAQVKYFLPDSITARGTQVGGIVLINTPNVELNQERVDVPPSFLALENLVAQACASDQGQNRSQFTITGRGGLPPSSTEPLSSEAVRVTTARQAVKQQRQASLKLPRPATGWGVNTKGQVVLTSGADNSVQTWLPIANCHVR